MATKIPNTSDSWETGLLGRDADYVTVADPSRETDLDAALGLQAISIRLPKQLIEQYRLIAHFHHLGYQPLMRDVLARFVPGALKEILEAEKGKAKRAIVKATAPVPRRKAA